MGRPHDQAAPIKSLRVLAWPARTTLNPYNELLADSIQRRGHRVEGFSRRRALLGNWDIMHLHWPENLVTQGSVTGDFKRLVWFGALLRWLKWRGVSVVWTVHNAGSHSRRHPRLERTLRRLLSARVSGFIYLNEHDLSECNEYSRKHICPATFHIPHGHYLPVLPYNATSSQSRADRRWILYFGQIKPYKGVEHLVQAHRALEEPARNPIQILGKCEDQDIRSTLIKAQGPLLDLHLGFFDNVQLMEAAERSLLVVLPYCEVTNSGSLMMALSLGLPVLTTEYPAAREVQAIVGNEWVRIVEHLNAESLAGGIEWASGPRQGPPDLSAFNWDTIAKLTVEAYLKVCAP